MKKRTFFYTLLFLLLASFPGIGSAMIAPHWQDNALFCLDCHLEHSGTRTACTVCHINESGENFTARNAPKVKTHFTMTCESCHNPHASGQCSLPAVDGSFSGYTVNSDTTTFTITNYIVRDAQWNLPASWAAKTGQERGLILVVHGGLLDSTRNPPEYVDYSAEVVSAGAGSITVKGTHAGTALTGPKNFALYYGQYIKPVIGGKTVKFNGRASYAHNDGLAADGNDSTPDGICQVCHTQTDYWRNNGTGAIHNNDKPCANCHIHKDGFHYNCNSCHGLPPTENYLGYPDGLMDAPYVSGSQTAGKHAIHAAATGYNYPCGACHVGGMIRVCVCNKAIDLGFDAFGFSAVGTSYDGQSTLTPPITYLGGEGTTTSANGSMICTNLYCHGDGTAVATRFFNPTVYPGPANVTAAWDGSTPDPDGNKCNNCHQYPPVYERDQPKANNHARHQAVGYGNCSHCHFKTTQNGQTIADMASHVNAVYNVDPGPAFVAHGTSRPLDFDYIYDAGGGTCLNNACHQYWGMSDPVRWGWSSISAAASVQDGEACGEIIFNINVYGGYPDVTPPYSCYYEWGDGTVQNWSENCSVHHTYAAPGSYTVKWSVRDANRHTIEGDDLTPYRTTAVVAPCPPPPPVGVPTMTVTVSPTDGHTATVKITAGTDGLEYTYIDWRDGSKTGKSARLLAGQSMDFVHVYTITGTRELKVKLRDGKGTYHYFSQYITLYTP